MVMVFGPPGRALLVIIGHLLFFSDILQLAQGLPFDFNQTTSSIDLEKRAPGGADLDLAWEVYKYSFG